MQLFKTPWRICGVAGILFVTLSLIASGVNGLPPVYNQDKAIMPAWFAVNGTSYLQGHFLTGLAILLFYFPFFAGFCERLRQAEGTPSIWSRVAWGGAIMSPAIATMAGAFIVGVALLRGGISPDISKFAIAANFYGYVVSGAMNGVAMIGAAVVILRTRVFWHWPAWAGMGIGLIAIAGSGAIVENDPKGLLAGISGFAWWAYFFWITVMSVELMRARTRVAPKPVSFDPPPVTRKNLIDAYVGAQDKQNDIMAELKKLNRNVERLMEKEASRTHTGS